MPGSSYADGQRLTAALFNAKLEGPLVAADIGAGAVTQSKLGSASVSLDKRRLDWTATADGLPLSSGSPATIYTVPNAVEIGVLWVVSGDTVGGIALCNNIAFYKVMFAYAMGGALTVDVRGTANNNVCQVAFSVSGRNINGIGVRTDFRPRTVLYSVELYQSF